MKLYFCPFFSLPTLGRLRSIDNVIYEGQTYNKPAWQNTEAQNIREKYNV